MLLKNKYVLMGGFQIISGRNWLVQAYVSAHRMFFFFFLQKENMIRF